MTAMMDDETRQRLDAWWDGLSDAERDELLPLHDHEVLPERYVPALTRALGAPPYGGQWEPPNEWHTHVPRVLAEFLDDKRSRGGAPPPSR